MCAVGLRTHRARIAFLIRGAAGTETRRAKWHCSVRRFSVGSAARKKRNRSRIPPSRPRFAVASPGPSFGSARPTAAGRPSSAATTPSRYGYASMVRSRHPRTKHGQMPTAPSHTPLLYTKNADCQIGRQKIFPEIYSPKAIPNGMPFQPPCGPPGNIKVGFSCIGRGPFPAFPAAPRAPGTPSSVRVL
jgi:hypothetical protein